jgi:hypothetical protein
MEKSGSQGCGEIMELQNIIGIVLLGVSMFCLGYAIAYIQILKKLLQMLEEESKCHVGGKPDG